jgi:DNA repair protein RecO (recombination protein O)
MTDTEGRIDLIVRSARGKKSHPVFPFCLYELSWAGKGSLKHLQSCEQLAGAVRITGSNLFCAFYLNEIIYRLLPQHEPEHALLSSYSRALDQLAGESEVESVLREFELVLLDVLGYGLDFRSDKLGAALRKGGHYLFVPEVGLTLLVGEGSDDSNCQMQKSIAGRAEQFQAIAQRDFSDPDVRHLAKQVLRAALAIYLGNRPLRSRELFR